MNCEDSELGWLCRSSNGNRRRRRQVDLVSRGGVGLTLAGVGLARSWVSHSLALVLLSVSLRHGDTALCLFPSRRHRHGPLNLIKMGLCTLYLYLYLCLVALASHFPFFFIFFFLCFLLSRFGFGLLRAEFFFYRLTWVMGSALSWLDDGLGEGGVHDFWERGRS